MTDTFVIGLSQQSLLCFGNFRGQCLLIAQVVINPSLIRSRPRRYHEIIYIRHPEHLLWNYDTRGETRWYIYDIAGEKRGLDYDSTCDTGWSIYDAMSPTMWSIYEILRNAQDVTKWLIPDVPFSNTISGDKNYYYTYKFDSILHVWSIYNTLSEIRGWIYVTMNTTIC